MSHVRITHDTTYRYQVPVEFGRHRLVLWPREGHDVRILEQKLSVSPAYTVHWTRDLFGNNVATLLFSESSKELHIQSSVLIEQLDYPAVDLTRLTPDVYPAIYSSHEQGMAQAYANLSYPEHRQALFNWLQQTVNVPASGNAINMLTQLNTAIFERIGYQRREEAGVQDPAETLRLSSGSCRDKATLFMDAARTLGVAARFVSGYLDCQASQAGRASTHAWAEAYLPHCGWLGFDPTLGENTSSKHTAIGVSHHPRGVMPVSGSFTGSRSHYLGLTVQVKFERV